ncbi:hypothetical protein EGW08_009700 [Elysia chlorotica]|uniref:Uncharacterized protein n=1 Tax=Elysia chlorotica TaxID=188477 RepID=A0A433TLX0_ELYCH|nr:hypothetical protein EGW08_009700 [Elysia chlorotica]
MAKSWVGLTINFCGVIGRLAFSESLLTRDPLKTGQSLRYNLITIFELGELIALGRVFRKLNVPCAPSPGSLHFGACDLDPFVPVYMVSSGALFLAFLAALVLVCLRCRHQGEDEGDDRVSPLHLLVLFYFFIHIVLQLAGSVCVIRARNDLQEIRRSELASSVTETSVVAQHTVKLIAPEVTPAYPIMEPVLPREAPVVSQPLGPRASCSAGLLDFAFAAVVVELVISGLFFVFIVASLLELAYIVWYEPSVGVKKTIVKANTRSSIASA